METLCGNFFVKTKEIEKKKPTIVIALAKESKLLAFFALILLKIGSIVSWKQGMLLTLSLQ